MLTEYQKEIMSDAKNWLLECYDHEHDIDVIKSLNYEQIVEVINDDFVGGFKHFCDTLQGVNKN